MVAGTSAEATRNLTNVTDHDHHIRHLDDLVDHRNVHTRVLQMIKIERNENFPRWIRVWLGDHMVEEHDNQRRALRQAIELARARQQRWLLNMGEYYQVDLK